ncbi:MAG: hypothetical protein WBV61_06660 [Rhodanobacteraceae bacterium]
MIEAVNPLNPPSERAVSGIALEAIEEPCSSPEFFAIATQPAENRGAPASMDSFYPEYVVPGRFWYVRYWQTF